MNFLELREYVGVMERNGEKVDRYAMALQQKLAFPIACILLALLGYILGTGFGLLMATVFSSLAPI